MEPIPSAKELVSKYESPIKGIMQAEYAIMLNGIKKLEEYLKTIGRTTGYVKIAEECSMYEEDSIMYTLNMREYLKSLGYSITTDCTELPDGTTYYYTYLGIDMNNMSQ